MFDTSRNQDQKLLAELLTSATVSIRTYLERNPRPQPTGESPPAGKTRFVTLEEFRQKQGLADAEVSS